MRSMKARAMFLTVVAILLVASPALRAQEPPPPKGDVIEDIVARVNDDVITTFQYQQAKQALLHEIKQACSGCNQAKIDSEYQQQEKNVLSDLIDQSLLVQRAKDEGINVDADVIKQLDQIRQQNHLDSMEALQQAVEASGMNWDDYKSSITRQFLTQKLIQQDVGGTIQIDPADVKKYYEAHKSEFNLPETVVLREMFFSTQGKSPAEVAAIKKKAEDIRQRVLNGDDFGQLAKLFSNGPDAQDGGEMGSFQRGQLAKPVEDAVFKLQHNQLTPVIDTPQGFEFFQVEQHYQAGIQPLEAVENKIESELYQQKMPAAYHDFLKELRKESYIRVKPGYVDANAVAETPIEEVAPGTDTGKNKKKKGRG